MLQKLQRTPGFLRDARAAKQAYQQQIQSAEAAVREWAVKVGAPLGVQLKCTHRADPARVGLCSFLQRRLLDMMNRDSSPQADAYVAQD